MMWTRREMIKVAGAVTVAGPALAAVPVIRDRALRWLAMLDDDARGRALRGFDDPLRKSWSFMHGSAVAPGLPLEDMDGPQKDAALDLLSAGLNAQGFDAAQNIMLQQDILRDEWGKGRADRNRERFSLILFGTPDPVGFWGWRFEGHHLSLNYTMRGDEVVSTTPSSFSSEPNNVPSGPHQGLVVLPNEALGRALFADLDDGAARAALLDPQSFGNILTTAGNESRVDQMAGVPFADLPQGQADMAAALVALYMADHLPGDLVPQVDLTDAHFGWAGGTGAEQSIYYRLHSPAFLIEFATLRGQPQHHHAICHDLRRNFGAHVV